MILNILLRIIAIIILMLVPRASWLFCIRNVAVVSCRIVKIHEEINLKSLKSIFLTVLH